MLFSDVSGDIQISELFEPNKALEEIKTSHLGSFSLDEDNFDNQDAEMIDRSDEINNTIDEPFNPYADTGAPEYPNGQCCHKS